MNDNYKFFDNIPHIGYLFLEQTLFSFENVPVVFVCMDKNNFRYLCVCDDMIEEESWLIVRISNAKLLGVLNDDCTVLSAFVNQNVIIANRKFNQSIEYDFAEYNNISKDELPVSDQYLEMKNSLKTYIENVEKDIACFDWKLSFSCFDISEENLDVSNIVVSVRKACESELQNNLLANKDIADILDLSKPCTIGIDLKTNNEPIVIKEDLSIAYAA